MKYEQLKNGTFRWRKKFRVMPTREQLVKSIGIDWLANRLYNIMYRHIFNMLPDKVQMVRVLEWEFVYIIHECEHFVSIEIIQKKPFHYADLY